MSNHGGPRKGAGRPPKNDPLIRRTIAMNAADWAAFDNLKRERNTTNPDLIRLLVTVHNLWDRNIMGNANRPVGYVNMQPCDRYEIAGEDRHVSYLMPGIIGLLPVFASEEDARKYSSTGDVHPVYTGTRNHMDDHGT